jgi:hypothetical protein
MAWCFLVAAGMTPMLIALALHRTRWWWLPAGLIYLAACGLFVFDDIGLKILAVVAAVYATILWGLSALIRYVSLRQSASSCRNAK